MPHAANRAATNAASALFQSFVTHFFGSPVIAVGIDSRHMVTLTTSTVNTFRRVKKSPPTGEKMGFKCDFYIVLIVASPSITF